MSQAAPYAGVELGGTKCIAVLARSPGEIIEQVRIDTGTPNETLGGIERTLAGWKQEHGIRSLGIASFGPVDLDLSSPSYGSIVATTKPGWSHTDVVRRLGRVSGAPAAFDTDVNGAALAELRWGAGRGLADLAYVTVGTGVGVGLIVNGAPVHGYAHPELGHLRVARRESDDWPGACPFHGGCVEGLASGPAIKARLDGRSVDELSTDDPLWDSVGWALAQLCHVLVCTTAPARILVGGGVTEKQPHLLQRAERMLVDSLNGYVSIPDDYVQPPELGGMAGPLGAIALAMSVDEAA